MKKAFQKVSYITAEQARAIDDELMGPIGYSLAQLMELAGLACARAVTDAYPAARKFLFVCGPGNNGGDGLVAARHASLFGRSCTVCYPKPSKGAHFDGLVQQLQHFKIPILPTPPPTAEMDSFDVVVDACFGFSFTGAVRPPFDDILRSFALLRSARIACIDIPSGWHVNDGPANVAADMRFDPDMLISLTLPKQCATHFHGRAHYVGGRFVPPSFAERLGLQMPEYPGSSDVVLLE